MKETKNSINKKYIKNKIGTRNKKRLIIKKDSMVFLYNNINKEEKGNKNCIKRKQHRKVHSIVFKLHVNVSNLLSKSD